MAAVHIHVLFVFLFINFCNGQRKVFTTIDDLENHISPEDLEEFSKMVDENNDYNVSTTSRGSFDTDAPDQGTTLQVPETVDCFGLGSLVNILFNMRPASSSEVNTHFFFTSRRQPNRVQVLPGQQFGLEWVDFDPSRRTVIIVHGFMSHSNASWVHDMTNAFLSWEDVNVIAVDWSRGGNTWKYWRAVANTWRVGSDVTRFLSQLIAETGANIKDFHFVGHSLGAHISSYISNHLGRVGRITGLDPAQPCFRTSNLTVKLDKTDADFVDVIHTNGRLLKRMGLGLPDPIGHVDFYPNGGMKQPGCLNRTSFLQRLMPFTVSRLQQAICSHGRAYLLFTESLINNNCSFEGHRWNLTYEGINASLGSPCDHSGSCAEMGINAAGGMKLTPATGLYFVLTTEKEPYCPTEWQRRHPRSDLLWDLKFGFQIDRSMKTTTNRMDEYADPELVQDFTTTTEKEITTTTKRSWWNWG